mgnify:FL=1
MKNLGLCKGRHEIASVEKYIFDENYFSDGSKIKDLSAQMSHVINFVIENNLQRQEVNLYVTGLTVALISVLNAFKISHIKVNLYHFDRDTNTYFKQEVLRGF